MRLYIRAKDLQEANYANNDDCPIARAFKRKNIQFTSIIPCNARLGVEYPYRWTTEADDKVNNACIAKAKKGFHINVTAV